MTCLSKGLGAPVGSVIAGRADDMVDRPGCERKRLGGGMRQAGVLAAPGLVALRDHVERLAEDHARARRLAEAVAERWPGRLDPAGYAPTSWSSRHDEARQGLRPPRGHGVLAGTLGPGAVRLVTHLDVDDAGIDQACRAIATTS